MVTKRYATGGDVSQPVTDTSQTGGINLATPAPQTSTSANVAAATAGDPTGSTTADDNSAIMNLEAQQATNPSLAPGTQQTATLLQDTPDQELSDSSGQVGATPTAATTSAGPAAQVSDNFNTSAAQYGATLTGGQGAQGTAAQISPTEQAGNQAIAAQGTLSPEDLVSQQYQDITKTTNADGVPDFARNAVNAANAQLSARGLGGSSIAAGAQTAAILGAALPIAQGNASAALQIALANLSNQQQAVITNANNNTQTSIANLSAANQIALLNTQNNQSALLSDQAATNAAAQFNAASQNQTNQFFANLATQIATQNANAANTMAQFDAGQANSMAQFNSNLQNQRDLFNAQNQLVVDQSNVQWRRSINTTNTAATNAANQVNAQNLFNQTQTAQANLWQQWRDEASWANTASQNALTRQHNLAVAALSSNTAFGLNNQAQTQELNTLLGQFGLNVLNAASPSITSGLTSLLG